MSWESPEKMLLNLISSFLSKSDTTFPIYTYLDAHTHTYACRWFEKRKYLLTYSSLAALQCVSLFISFKKKFLSCITLQSLSTTRNFCRLHVIFVIGCPLHYAVEKNFFSCKYQSKNFLYYTLHILSLSCALNIFTSIALFTLKLEVPQCCAAPYFLRVTWTEKKSSCYLSDTSR